MGRADGSDEPSHLIDREHVGESLLLPDAEPLEGRPVAGRGVGIEELDAAVGDAQRAGGELLVVLEVEEVVADLLLAEPVGRGVEVVGELPDGAEVGLLGALAQAGELEVLVHPLAECRGHESVPLARGERSTSARNHEARTPRLPGSAESAGNQGNGEDHSTTLADVESACRASGLLEHG